MKIKVIKRTVKQGQIEFMKKQRKKKQWYQATFKAQNRIEKQHNSGRQRSKEEWERKREGRHKKINKNN